MSKRARRFSLSVIALSVIAIVGLGRAVAGETIPMTLIPSGGVVDWKPAHCLCRKESVSPFSSAIRQSRDRSSCA